MITPIEHFKAQLMPPMEALLECLSQTDDMVASGFFTEIYGMLCSACEEDELIEVCLALSTSAFQGFEFDPQVFPLLDALLARAEQLAHTFSASNLTSH